MKQTNDVKPQKQVTPDRSGNVADAATQEHAQAREAVRQMGEKSKLNINEGGRTQDSSAKENPPGAVHGLPTPALKGTWR